MPVQSGGSRKGYSSRYKCAENVLARGPRLPVLPWAEFVAGYQRCAVSRVSRTRIAWLCTKETYAPLPPSDPVHHRAFRMIYRAMNWNKNPPVALPFSQKIRDTRRIAFCRGFPARSSLPLPFSAKATSRRLTRKTRQNPRKFGVRVTSVNFISLWEPYSRVVPLPPFSVYPSRHADMPLREYARGAGIPRGFQCIFMGLEVQIY